MQDNCRRREIHSKFHANDFPQETPGLPYTEMEVPLLKIGHGADFDNSAVGIGFSGWANLSQARCFGGRTGKQQVASN